MHAFPHRNPNVTHGYYRQAPYFSPAQRAAILRIAGQGPPLTGELILVRLKLRDAFAYMSRQKLPPAEETHVARLLFQGTGTVARLLQAQAALANLRWGPYSAGGTGKMLEHMRRQEQSE